MNKYERIYNRLIDKAKTRDYISKRWRIGSVEPNEEVETHHIIPKSLGGSNKKDNLVVFTLKEHFIAHYLLTKIYNGNYKMLRAFNLMCKNNPNRSANEYKILRDNMSKVLSEQVLKFYEREDSRKIISEASKENWKRPEYREKQKEILSKRNTEEFRKKLSIVQKKVCENEDTKKRKYKSIEKHSKEKSEEWIKMMSEINSKRMNSPEWKKWSSDKYKGSKFDNRRKVLDKLDGTVYNSAMDAAKARGLKYEVVKKWLYKGIPKHDLVWLEEEKKDD